VIGGGTA